MDIVDSTINKLECSITDWIGLDPQVRAVRQLSIETIRLAA
jgi:hypothetical protein